MDQGKSFFLASIVIAVAIIVGFYVHGVAQRGGSAPPAPAPSDSAPSPVRASSGKREVIDFRDAPKYIDQEVTVRGRVVRVNKPKETTFINFCIDYRSCEFAAVIFKSAADKFPDAFSWEGKTVEITGRVKEYKGTAEIILNDPSQVRVVD
jgi:DNA/RNA endonuclease YhcR with UshA esterase domain